MVCTESRCIPPSLRNFSSVIDSQNLTTMGVTVHAGRICVVVAVFMQCFGCLKAASTGAPADGQRLSRSGNAGQEVEHGRWRLGRTRRCWGGEEGRLGLGVGGFGGSSAVTPHSGPDPPSQTCTSSECFASQTFLGCFDSIESNVSKSESDVSIDSHMFLRFSLLLNFGGNYRIPARWLVVVRHRWHPETQQSINITINHHRICQVFLHNISSRTN